MPVKAPKVVSSKTTKKSTVAKKVGNSKKEEELKDLDGLADKSQEWNSESTDASVEDSGDESDKKSDTDHAHNIEEEDEDEEEDEEEDDENEKSAKSNTPVQLQKKLAVKKPVSVLHNDRAPNKDAFQKVQPLLKGRVSLNKSATSNVSYGDKTDGYNQSIAKFSQYEYRDSTMQLKDASVADLLKSAIVKSRDVGQKHLMNVLYQTLKATNMECEFPLITDRKQRSQPKKNTYDNKNQNGRYRDDF